MDNLKQIEQCEMEIKEAIEILKIERGCAELDISNGDFNQHTINFAVAVSVVLSEMEHLMGQDK